MTWFEKLTSMHDYYTGNIAAMILVFCLFASHYSESNSKRQDYRMIFHLLANIFLYSAAEIMSCMFDGVEGSGARVMLYLMNSLLYAENMLMGLSWVQLIVLHLGYMVPDRVKSALLGTLLVGALFLIINPLTSLVFVVENNTYAARGPLYFMYVLFGMLYLGYTIYVYMVCRKSGGVLKYFPIWMYVGPSVAGILLEWWLGNSMISVCNAIAMTGVLSSLRQEEVFRDRLTGLYNRAYLEELKTKLGHQKNSFVSGIMLDLNDFKGINDNYGHSEGDQALIISSDLIRRAVGSGGDVIRYAGDEFIVILNTLDKDKMKTCVKRIERAFENYNSKAERPYRLTVSMGYANFNAETQTVNEFLNMIDRNMYENKRRFYEAANNDRRKRYSN